MKLRRFPIPVAALGLTAATGCTPAIVGDWDLKSWKIDGVGVSFHYSGYTYYGSYAQVDVSVKMTVEKDLTGSLDMNTVISGLGSISYDGDVEAEAVSGEANTWDVTITMQSEDLELECTVDKDAMDCDGESDDGTDHEMGWERDE